MRGDRARFWLAVALWLVFGFVVWNVVFDDEIRVATDVYLARQGLHDGGGGPRVSIDSVMQPAKKRAFQRASLWGGAAAIAGIGMTAALTRRR